MKKLFIGTTSLLLLVLIFSRKDKNVKNIQRITPEMSMLQVRSVMGEPYRIDTYSIGNDSCIVYYYLNNELGASDHYHVTFSNRDKKVVNIDFGT